MFSACQGWPIAVCIWSWESASAASSRGTRSSHMKFMILTARLWTVRPHPVIRVRPPCRLTREEYSPQTGWRAAKSQAVTTGTLASPRYPVSQLGSQRRPGSCTSSKISSGRMLLASDFFCGLRRLRERGGAGLSVCLGLWGWWGGFFFWVFLFVLGLGCLSCLLRAGRCVLGRIHLAIFSTSACKKTLWDGVATNTSREVGVSIGLGQVLKLPVGLASVHALGPPVRPGSRPTGTDHGVPSYQVSFWGQEAGGGGN